MYSMQDLVTLSNVSHRRIRRLIQLGVLPRPENGRRFARYSDDHLRKLRAIREEEDRRVTYADFAERWNGTPGAFVTAARAADRMSSSGLALAGL